MKLFRHMNITRKLALVVGSLLVGFVGIGAAYFAQLQVERGLVTRTAILERFADVVNQSRVDVILIHAAADFASFLWEASPSLCADALQSCYVQATEGGRDE